MRLFFNGSSPARMTRDADPEENQPNGSQKELVGQWPTENFIYDLQFVDGLAILFRQPRTEVDLGATWTHEGEGEPRGFNGRGADNRRAAAQDTAKAIYNLNGKRDRAAIQKLIGYIKDYHAKSSSASR